MERRNNRRLWMVFFLNILVIRLFSVGAVKTSLNVLTPQSTDSLGGAQSMSHHAATFGFSRCPYFAKTRECRIEAEVLYASSFLCTDQDRTLVLQELLLVGEQATENQNNDWQQQPVFLMIHRGLCSLAEKTRQAQKVANEISIYLEGLLIATTPECSCLSDQATCLATDNVSPDLCQVDAPKGEEDTTDVYLPTAVLLDPNQVTAIQEHLTASSNRTLRMEFMWEIVPRQQSNINDTIVIDFWHLPSPYRYKSSDIPHELGRVLLEPLVDRRIQFNPKFYIESGEELGCYGPPDNMAMTVFTNRASTEFCESHCTNKGRYCVGNSAVLVLGEVYGADLIEESLRRMCILNNFADDPENPSEKWWGYLEAFYIDCTADNAITDVSNNPRLTSTCSQAAMAAAGIDYITVSRCGFLAGGTTQDTENTLLESSLLERLGNAELRAILPPTAIVNSIAFRGETLSETVNAICASFMADTLPEQCLQCVDCVNEHGCIVNAGLCSNLAGQLVVPPTLAPTVTLTITSTDEKPNTTTPAPSTLLPLGDLSVAPSSNKVNLTGQPTDSLTGADSDNRQEENSDGLSDATKLVIVVAVVGGAIVAIFIFVVILVWKLLKRIRRLEGKENDSCTATTGSPFWKLPFHVITATPKEDPSIVYSVQSDSLPPQKRRAEPLITEAGLETGGENNPSFATFDARVAYTTDEMSDKNIPPKLKDAIWEIHSKAKKSNKNTYGILKSESLRRAILGEQASHVAASTATSGGASDEISSSAASKGKAQKQQQNCRNSSSNTGTTDSPDRSKVGEERLAPKQKLKVPFLEIMGRAAPEGRRPKSFSFQNEEKEEEQSYLEV